MQKTLKTGCHYHKFNLTLSKRVNMKDPDDFETRDMSELDWKEFIGATAKVFTTKDKMYIVKGGKDEDPE